MRFCAATLKCWSYFLALADVFLALADLLVDVIELWGGRKL